MCAFNNELNETYDGSSRVRHDIVFCGGRRVKKNIPVGRWNRYFFLTP